MFRIASKPLPPIPFPPSGLFFFFFLTSLLIWPPGNSRPVRVRTSNYWRISPLLRKGLWAPKPVNDFPYIFGIFLIHANLNSNHTWIDLYYEAKTINEQNPTDDEDSITLSLSLTWDRGSDEEEGEKLPPSLIVVVGTKEKKKWPGRRSSFQFPKFPVRGKKNPVFVSILRPHFLPSFGDFNELARQKKNRKNQSIKMGWRWTTWKGVSGKL